VDTQTLQSQALLDKCRSFTKADEAKASGLYPYFKPISESEDTVVVTPPGLVPGQNPANAPGVYSGKANARKVFAVLTGRGPAGARAMTTVVEPLGGDVALLRWTSWPGTPRQSSGIDVFVVRRGKIVMQDIIPDRPTR
jgi:hypothetical protein